MGPILTGQNFRPKTAVQHVNSPLIVILAP